MSGKVSRSSLELPDFLWEALEKEAQSQGKRKVELLREIIENNDIDTTRLKRSIVDFRLGKEYIQKLQNLADQALPEKAKGKRKGNKSAALQEILMQHFEKGSITKKYFRP